MLKGKAKKLMAQGPQSMADLKVIPNSIKFLVAIPEGVHLFPSRTQQLRIATALKRLA
ncbi:hypothetical protein [Desulforamulus reducens]|uniref:hypothetical protein n=1 Tax=Desulforamulus reducens TaxID=59610 RepID=UPI0002D8706D|nr:hypothetical protein [Desulforamulus reducens]